jgi:hypothetical protein
VGGGGGQPPFVLSTFLLTGTVPRDFSKRYCSSNKQVTSTPPVKSRCCIIQRPVTFVTFSPVYYTAMSPISLMYKTVAIHVC